MIFASFIQGFLYQTCLFPLTITSLNNCPCLKHRIFHRNNSSIVLNMSKWVYYYLVPSGEHGRKDKNDTFNFFKDLIILTLAPKFILHWIWKNLKWQSLIFMDLDTVVINQPTHDHFVVCFSFWDKVSLCSPYYPGNIYVYQPVLSLTKDPPVCDSQML